MNYMGIGEWIMYFLCMMFVLPWLLGALLIVRDLKRKWKKK